LESINIHIQNYIIMENEILEIFRSVFNEEDSSSITLETEFRDLAQFTSLTQVVLIDAIQNQLNVKLKLLPLIKAETIGDVLELVENNG